MYETEDCARWRKFSLTMNSGWMYKEELYKLKWQTFVNIHNVKLYIKGARKKYSDIENKKKTL